MQRRRAQVRVRARKSSDIEPHAIDRRNGLSYVSVMAVLPIITIPDPVLRKISDPVERVDDAVVKLMDDMLETMYAAPGVGLAAVQVGVLKRVVVIDAAEDEACRIRSLWQTRNSSHSGRRRGCMRRAAFPLAMQP